MFQTLTTARGCTEFEVYVFTGAMEQAMSMPNDTEMNQLLEEDGPTTQKINKRLSDYEQRRLQAEAKAEERRKRAEAEQEERILKQMRPIVEEQEKQSKLFSGLTKRMTESFSGLLRLDEKLNDKK
jgi:hypothetical protein